MGVVIVCDQVFNEKLELVYMCLGFGVGMDDVYMVLCSLFLMCLCFEVYDVVVCKVVVWFK